MNDGILAAAVGSLAPTLASLLAYANARAARHESERNNLVGLSATVDGFRPLIQQVESTVARIETAVSGLRERVARVEGRIDGASAVRRQSAK